MNGNSNEATISSFHIHSLSLKSLVHAKAGTIQIQTTLEFTQKMGREDPEGE
jgi:hypothetical protein